MVGMVIHVPVVPGQEWGYGKSACRKKRLKGYYHGCRRQEWKLDLSSRKIVACVVSNHYHTTTTNTRNTVKAIAHRERARKDKESHVLIQVIDCSIQ